MKKFDLAIVGIVGLPASYGGFETLADQIVIHLGSQKNIQVFCSSITKNVTSNLEKKYLGSTLTYVRWRANGWQSPLYDAISMWRGAKTSRTLLILGVSGCIFLPFIRIFWPDVFVVTNVDGIEWKRDKWGFAARFFLRISEWFAIKFSDDVVADNYGIQEYLLRAYGCNAKLIAYGGDQNLKNNFETSISLGLQNGKLATKFYLTICRIEPENSINEILLAFKDLPDETLVMVGNWNSTVFSKRLYDEFSGAPNILLLNPIYESEKLNYLRGRAIALIHGHKAGGTNPSLVEGMSHGLPVLAKNVIYNRHTTNDMAMYWDDVDDLLALIKKQNTQSLKVNGESMKKYAQENYTWNRVIQQYYSCLKIDC